MRVRECSEESCPLHPCRLVEDGDDAVFIACIRAFCLSCAGSSEAVEECAADRPMGGQPACPAHSYRNAEAPPPQCVHPASVQQVRLLPGLGSVCASVGKRQHADEAGDGGMDESGTLPAAKPMARREGLNIATSERAPEALDI
jgi:hypothetical protein